MILGAKIQMKYILLNNLNSLSEVFAAVCKVTSKNHLLLGFVLENRILGILGEEKNRPQKS